MPLRFYVLFLLFTLFFLFYPGDSHYYHLFAYNRDLFETEKQYKLPQIKPFPYIPAASAPEVSAEGVYIIDVPTFTPVFEKNLHQHFLPASTTKIITALVASDVYKPDDVITIKDVKNEGQIMGLVPGERITVENLLYGVLVHSGNDAAYALADAYGFDRFVELMNEKAKSLYMNNSHFTNPAGLDDPAQYTTPFDLALASRELLNHPTLKKTVGIKEITISDVDFNYFHPLANVNRLLGEVQGVGGLKTGYTENAGENLVSFYTKNGHQFIIVIVKSNDRFQDTKNVIDWINANVQYVKPEVITP